MDRAIRQIGENVKRRRQELDVSQRDVAVLAGIDVSTLSRLERGVENPTLQTMLSLAVTLECELPELLRGVQSAVAAD
jgi:transcriptional regulator with XRE-family HTH domain